MNTPLIHSDDEIEVHFHKGTSDWLLITFGSLNELADGTRYFGKALGEKVGFNVLGFVAKTPNWYPSASIMRAAEYLSPILNDYADRLTYGSSMGGYGAIKHSGLLGASTVVAMAPQWSIDPAQVGIFDRRYQKHFVPGKTGTAIEASDISGNVFIFADPRYSPDMEHACRIARSLMIPVHNVTHHVAGALAGTQNIQEIFRLARANDALALQSTAAIFRRKSPRRVAEVLMKASSKHRPWADAIFQNHRHRLNGNAQLESAVARSFAAASG